MISLAQHYGQFIVADATYKTNEFGRPLLIFTARAGTGAFAIVAVVLIPSESKENLTWAFDQLREVMGSEAFQRIEVVMTDGDRSYPSILETLLPNTVHQLCWWHQQRNMRPFCGIASDPTECWSLMIEAIKTFDPVEAEAKWKELIDKFFSQSVLQVHVTKKSKEEAASRKTQRNRLPAWAEELPCRYYKALRLLMDWYDERHFYWKAYTRGYCNFGSIASQGGESMNNVVKERSFVELDDLMQMTQDVSETQLIVQLDESWKAQARTPLGTGLDQWYRILRTSLTMFATNELTMQLNLAKTKKYAFVSNQQKPYLYTVRNSKGRDFTVNVNEMTCTCGWISSRRLTCRHVLVTCQDRLPIPKLAEVVVGRAHPRWLHSTLQQALGLKDLQANVEPAVHEQVETERRLHLPSTNNMMQIAVKDEVQAIVEFARKSAMNARYALACLHRWIPELRNANESMMEAAIALTQQSNVAANVQVSPTTAHLVAAAVADSDSAAAIPRVDPLKVGLHRVRVRKTSNASKKKKKKRRIDVTDVTSAVIPGD